MRWVIIQEKTKVIKIGGDETKIVIDLPKLSIDPVSGKCVPWRVNHEDLLVWNISNHYAAETSDGQERMT